MMRRYRRRRKALVLDSVPEVVGTDTPRLAPDLRSRTHAVSPGREIALSPEAPVSIAAGHQNLPLFVRRSAASTATISSSRLMSAPPRRRAPSRWSRGPPRRRCQRDCQRRVDRARFFLRERGRIDEKCYSFQAEGRWFDPKTAHQRFRRTPFLTGSPSRAGRPAGRGRHDARPSARWLSRPARRARRLRPLARHRVRHSRGQEGARIAPRRRQRLPLRGPVDRTARPAAAELDAHLAAHAARLEARVDDEGAEADERREREPRGPLHELSAPEIAGSLPRGIAPPATCSDTA